MKKAAQRRLNVVAMLYLKQEQTNNAAFAEYWGIAGEWNPNSRYESTDEGSALLFVEAVNDPNAGILWWIKQHW